jgi:hypothetical protein
MSSQQPPLYRTIQRFSNPKSHRLFANRSSLSPSFLKLPHQVSSQSLSIILARAKPSHPLPPTTTSGNFQNSIDSSSSRTTFCPPGLLFKKKRHVMIARYLNPISGKFPQIPSIVVALPFPAAPNPATPPSPSGKS